MAIVHLPAQRPRVVERTAPRQGVSGPQANGLRLVKGGAPLQAFCASCAAPIEFGAVTRGAESFCSVECSLGGNRPA
jgi:hypothetical protein